MGLLRVSEIQTETKLVLKLSGPKETLFSLQTDQSVLNRLISLDIALSDNFSLPLGDWTLTLQSNGKEVERKFKIDDYINCVPN